MRLLSLLAWLPVLLASPGAHAQAYPSRTIALVVPAAPGGPSDALVSCPKS